MRVVHVIGARPNFMKVAPVFDSLARLPAMEQCLVHTGQHYDDKMSDVFFRQLRIPEPDVNLDVGSGSHAQQTAQVMSRIEPVLLERKPDWIIVYGDVNSTVAAALVSSKLGIRIAHVEAGLRSFDRAMPEEINRIVTDRLSDLLFTPSADGDDNLLKEGVPAERIRLVGNVMIDTLVRLLPEAAYPGDVPSPNRYVLATLHRPSNVDEPSRLAAVFAELQAISLEIPVIFPVHPRTRQRLEGLALQIGGDGPLHVVPPQGYLEFLALQKSATAVITDSGGVQEETTYLGIPCLTLRENTERPVTISHGTNTLIGDRASSLTPAVRRVLSGETRPGKIPPLWDGQAARRIASIFSEMG